MQLPVENSQTKHSHWMYALLVKDGFGLTRDDLRKKLYKKGIETRDFFVPMHRQPALLELGLCKGEKYPVADDIAQRGLYLPSGPAIAEKDIKFICETLRKLL